MSDPKDLEQLFESFMRDNQIEDQGFTEKIVLEVSSKPRLAYITNIYPVLGGFFGLIIFLLAKQNFSSINLSFVERSGEFFSRGFVQATSLYASYGSYAMMATLLLVAMYFILQPEKS